MSYDARPAAETRRLDDRPLLHDHPTAWRIARALWLLAAFLFVAVAVPALRDVVDGVDIMLKWRAGHEAALHEVYLGTDSTDLALVGTSDTASYDLSTTGLEYGRTYF